MIKNKWAVEFTQITGRWFLDCHRDDREYAIRTGKSLAECCNVSAVRVRNTATGEVVWTSEDDVR